MVDCVEVITVESDSFDATEVSDIGFAVFSDRGRTKKMHNFVALLLQRFEMKSSKD